MNGCGGPSGPFADVAREQGRALVERVAASMAHALASPLNVLELRLAKLRRVIIAGTDDVEQALRAVDEQTRRLIDLVSRPSLQARAARPRPERCDLRDVVEPILSLLGPAAQERSIALSLDIEPATVMVPLPTLRMIVLDIVSYAIGRTSMGGEVRIHVKRGPTHRHQAPMDCIEFLVKFANAMKLSDRQLFEPWFSEDTGELADRILLARSCGAVRDHGGWFDPDAESECIKMLWPLGVAPENATQRRP
jgi:signal transduction histidine kinase